MSNNLNILIMIAPVVVCRSVLWLNWRTASYSTIISLHEVIIAGVLNFKIAALAYTSGKVNIVE